MYDDLVKRLRDAAKMSEALAVLLPRSEGNATAKLYNEAADAIHSLDAASGTAKEGNMKEIKLKIDDYGYIYSEMPDGTIRELLADVFGNPYFGKIKLGKEVEAEGNKDSET